MVTLGGVDVTLQSTLYCKKEATLPKHDLVNMKTGYGLRLSIRLTLSLTPVSGFDVPGYRNRMNHDPTPV